MLQAATDAYLFIFTPVFNFRLTGVLRLCVCEWEIVCVGINSARAEVGPRQGFKGLRDLAKSQAKSLLIYIIRICAAAALCETINQEDKTALRLRVLGCGPEEKYRSEPEERCSRSHCMSPRMVAPLQPHPRGIWGCWRGSNASPLPDWKTSQAPLL